MRTYRVAVRNDHRVTKICTMMGTCFSSRFGLPHTTSRSAHCARIHNLVCERWSGQNPASGARPVATVMSHHVHVRLRVTCRTLQGESGVWRSYKVRVVFSNRICANKARIGSPSANQGISKDSHNSHHVHVTCRWPHPFCWRRISTSAQAHCTVWCQQKLPLSETKLGSRRIQNP